MQPQLRYDDRVRDVSKSVLHQKVKGIGGEAVRRLLIQASIELLPRWAKRMHGLDVSLPNRPVVHLGALTVASTLRWAFDRPVPRR